MSNETDKPPTPIFYLPVILAAIACISFFAINPIFGIIVGFLSWMAYKYSQKEMSFQRKSLPEETVNKDTKQLIETLISEKQVQTEKSIDSSHYFIRRGSLPMHIHVILDEMGITTWMQLSLLDEKELLYEKCFGEEALKNIKTELAKRGLTLNSPNNTI